MRAFFSFFKKYPSKQYAGFLFPALILVLLIPVWSFKYMPFQDSPNHLLSVQILNNIDSSEFNYSENFEISFSLFKPYAAYFLIMLFLTKIFPLLISEKIFISMYVILFAYSFRRVGKIVHPENLFLPFISLLFIYNVMLFLGFYQYLLSIPVFFFALAYFLKHAGMKNYIEIIAFNLILLILYFSHITTLAAFLITSGIVKINQTKSLKGMFLLYAKCLPAVALIVTSYLNYSNGEGIDLIYLTFFDMLKGIPRWFYYYGWFGIVVSIIVLAGLFMYLFLCRKEILKDTGGFIWAALVIFAVYLAVPLGINYEIWYVNYRFIPFMLLLPFLAFKVKLKPEAVHLIIGAAAVISIAATVNTFIFFEKTNDTIRAYLESTRYINNNAKILPLTTQVTGRIKILLHAWAYINVEKGGVSPYSFAVTGFHPIEYKQKPGKNYLPSPGEDKTEGLTPEIIDYYDYVVLSGKSKYVEQLMSRVAFSKVFKNDVVTVWKKGK